MRAPTRRFLWRHNRPRFQAMCEERGWVLETSSETWAKECRNKKYKPAIRCLTCTETVRTTSVENIQKGQGVGCACRNKTEAALGKWLRGHFGHRAQILHNTVSIRHEAVTGVMKVDFVLVLTRRTDAADADATDADAPPTPSVRVAIELDGAQHFVPVPIFRHTTDPDAFLYAARRDRAKEDALLADGTAVVRVLQDDVWRDRRHWRTWITDAVAKAEADAEAGAPPRVHLPARDAYRAGVYKDLRDDRAESVHAWEAHERPLEF